MRRLRGWLSGILVLAVASGAGAQGVGPSGEGGKQQEDPIKAAIEKFQKEYGEGQKKKDENMRATALDVFNGMCQDKKVVEIVGKVLSTSSETVMVKIKAATLLGQSGNPMAIATLEKAFGQNEKNDAAMEIVRQIGGLQDKSAVKTLEKIIRPRINRFDDEKACGIARAGIDALSRQRFIETVEALIKLFEPVVSGKPAADATIPPEEAEKEGQRNQSEGALLAALSGLTGQTLQTYDEWKQWWSKNKKTFKLE
ncbi:MAG: HEAT repeat domain-containing protein [Planctomycetota bacterium]